MATVTRAHLDADGFVHIQFRDTDSEPANPPFLVSLRNALASTFDTQVILTFSDTPPVIEIRGASGEKLGKDETGQFYKLWIQGFIAGYDAGYAEAP